MLLKTIIAMKEGLRQEFFQRRKKLSSQEVEEKSRTIKTLLARLPEYRTGQNISFYISRENEVKTHEMIKDCLNEGKTVSVPVIEGKYIQLSELKNFEDLKPGAFNILEPGKKRIINPAVLDVIIVPGLAFDLQGNRIGFGRGYYDRLLRETGDQTIRVALSFENQIADALPCTDLDEPVDLIITEKRIIRLED
jgi:5-formyltetrahydrofolate cyclo-ligase